MKAIRIHQFGGPEVLRYEDAPDPKPGVGEAVVAVEAAGVNFIDVYHRTGLYKNELPFTPGMEAAGTVVAVGEGVTEPAVGDRVAFAMQIGAYAQLARVPAWKLVPLPATLDAKAAAAAMLQGMTAHYLARDTFPLRNGQVALVHAAAGGVGLLLTQLAKSVGAVVIGTVSTPEKAQLARDAGADHVVIYTEQDFEAEVRRLTSNAGCHVVYDSVGKTTWEKSLACLRPRGYLVLYGNSSGPVPPIDPLLLSSKGSVYVTRPTLAHYSADRGELLARAGDVLARVASGSLHLRIERVFPLADAAVAHGELEGRRTTGKVLLTP
jgi:NADPH2:quinone reductase